MHLLYHKKSEPTGVALAEALGISHGSAFPFIGCAESDVIRWGNRVSFFPYGVGRVINHSNAMRNASDKLLSLQLMRDAGINIPQFNEDPHALLKEVGYPILGRKKNHVRGKDIILCLQERDLRIQRDFYTEYIPTKREYRIHVAFGEVIHVQGKYLVNNEARVSHIRNHQFGYVFRTPRLNLRPNRLEMAINAVKAHGLDFGAVDLIVADNDEGYVLEVNTAPACAPLTARAYVNAFAKELGVNQDSLNLNALNQLSEVEETDDEAFTEEEV